MTGQCLRCAALPVRIALSGWCNACIRQIELERTESHAEWMRELAVYFRDRVPGVELPKRSGNCTRQQGVVYESEISPLPVVGRTYVVETIDRKSLHIIHSRK